MRSYFEMGFRNGFNRPMLGQLDWIPTLISAGLQAGAGVYGAHMQETIAKMQKRTQEEIQAKQDAAAKAHDTAVAKQVDQQAKQEQVAAGAAPKIMGIDQSVFIMGGVGLAVVIGVIAIVASGKSSPVPAETVVA